LKNDISTNLNKVYAIKFRLISIFIFVSTIEKILTVFQKAWLDTKKILG